MRTETTKVEKRIPMPATYRGGRKWRFPFQEMEVGDSFLFPKKMTILNVGNYVQYARDRLKRKFTCRTTDEGVRCWRTK